MSNNLNGFNNGVGLNYPSTKDIDDIRTLNGLASISNDILAKPIGIVRKNHKFIEATLSRNIGNHAYDFDGFGTPISDISNPYLNSDTPSWFELDESKKEYKNYLDYVNEFYFFGTMPNSRFQSNTYDMITNDTSKSLEDLNNIGAVRGYDFRNDTTSYYDTRLGMINNYYLANTFQKVYENDENNKKNKSLTNNVYSNFGFDGSYGLKRGFSVSPNDIVSSNSAMNGNKMGIPTTDTQVFNMHFGDNESMYNNTNSKTKNFILKSLLGIDLIENDLYYDIDALNDVDMQWPQKYYPSQNKTTYLHKAFGDVTVLSNGVTDRVNAVIKGSGLSPQFGQLSVYSESDGIDDKVYPSNGGVIYGQHKTFKIEDSVNDIVKFTNERFKKGEYRTILGKFHTSLNSNSGEINDDDDFTSSAKSKYGMSMGRNLLRKDGNAIDVNGFDDPYCRVWTYHKQYATLDSLMRPFSREGGNDSNYNKLSSNLKSSYHINRDRLDQFTARHFNGLVQIAPTNKFDITTCMFSLENLAWKNEKNLTDGYSDQIGPNGGRIMWFPPYDLKFDESVSVSWNESNFIGRGEPIYTYTNTNRSGTLSFKLLIDHPSLLNNYRGNVNDTPNQNVDDVESTEQTLLRFFAGCEILQGRERAQSPIVISNSKKKIKLEPLLQPISVKNNISKQIVFYVFFPNNYTGVDDDAYGKIKPMEYLINGLGSGFELESVDKAKEMNSDFTNYGTFGGYEIDSKGISCVDSYNASSLTPFATVGSHKLCAQKVLNKAGKYNYWGYRVDKRVSNEVLSKINNYGDTSSFGLNSDGYSLLTNYHTDSQQYVENGSLYSFVDVFAALEPKSRELLKKKNVINEKTMLELHKLFEEYEVVSVETKGFASSHGTKKSNDILSRDRANSVMNWLIKVNHKFTKDKHTNLETQIGDYLPSKDVSSLEAKVWRCTKVVISLTKEEINTIEQQKTLTEGQINYFNKMLAKYADDANAKFLKGIKIDENTYNNLNQAQKAAVLSLLEKAKLDQLDKEQEAEEEGNTKQLGDTKDPGYGREYEFFSELSSIDSLMHSRLKDKIRYFDPAFHSVSPEGFNARLTFLHQCTRQGSTASATDYGNLSKTANNLSFGTPPVCVLRLGDFYNTKIIITNLTISFADTMWDLNDEGIGIMPMIADISLTFNFLGGSDLAGPISRLQNAVSFNYYANTNVYDDRADRIA